MSDAVLNNILKVILVLLYLGDSGVHALDFQGYFVLSLQSRLLDLLLLLFLLHQHLVHVLH